MELRKIPEMAEEAKEEAILQGQLRAQVISRILESEKDFPIPHQIEYGNAGFLDSEEVMLRVAFRVGLVTAMRAKLKGTYGVMISGGHRVSSINGVKIIEPDGGSLEHSWH